MSRKNRSQSLNAKNPEARRLAEAIANMTGDRLWHAFTEALRERYERLHNRQGNAGPASFMPIGSTRTPPAQNDPGHLNARLIHDTNHCMISVGSFLELSLVLERHAAPDAGRHRDTFFPERAVASSDARANKNVIDPLSIRARLSRRGLPSSHPKLRAARSPQYTGGQEQNRLQ